MRLKEIFRNPHSSEKLSKPRRMREGSVDLDLGLDLDFLDLGIHGIDDDSVFLYIALDLDFDSGSRGRLRKGFEG